MKKQRAHLRSRTTGLLYALAARGPGGATALTLAADSGMSPRSAAARLVWLRRGKLVRYVVDGARWQLTDDSMFTTAPRAQT